MPTLNAVITKLDDVEESLRGFYVEKDGKFSLQVSGVKTQADVDAVTRALANERTEHGKTKGKVTTLTEQVQAWTDAAGDGITPDKLKTNMEKLGTLEGASQPELTKNFQGLVQAEVAKIVDGRIKSETTKLQRQLDTAQAKITEQTGAITQFTQKDEQRTVFDQVRGAIEAAKVRPDAVMPLARLANGELKLVDGKVQTEDGRDAAQWVEDQKKVTPFFWPAAKGTGAEGSGAPGGVDSKDNPFTLPNHNMTKISALVGSNPAEAAKLAEQAGVPKDAAGNFIWHKPPPAAAK